MYIEDDILTFGWCRSLKIRHLCGRQVCVCVELLAHFGGPCCLVGDGHEPTDQLFSFVKTESLGGISLSLSDQHQAYGLSQPWAKNKTKTKTPTYAKSQHWEHNIHHPKN